MKLCIDCKHFRPNPHVPDDLQKGLCGALEGSRSPIDGAWVAYPHPSCFNARSTGCGQSGRLWESKTEDTVVILPNALGVSYE